MEIFDYDNILLLPRKCRVESRSECDTRVELGGRSFDMEQLFEEQTAGRDYFVVTLFSDWERQPKLQSMLQRNYPLLVEEDDYLIYDLRTKK